MEQKIIYPDFYTWQKKAITLKSGLVFAPEDFYIVKRQEYLITDDGCVGSATSRKDFFTGNEALELEEKILKPAGWRLPTKDDWQTTLNELKTLRRLRRKLKFTLEGYVDPDFMDEYNQNPSLSSAFGQGYSGYWWSSTQYCYPDIMHCMALLERLDPIMHINGCDFGYSIRCVARQYAPF